MDHPAEERWTETEVAIMEATIRAIKEHGYANLTLRKIAAEFEKSRALIYQYYRSKEELFAALVQYLIDQYEDHLDVDPDQNPEARLDAYIRVALFGAEDAPIDHWAFHTALLEFRIHGHHNDSIQPLLDQGYERVLGLVVAIVEAGIKQGTFRDVDPELAATFLIGTIDAARILKIVGANDGAPDLFYEAITELVLPGLRADTR